MSRGTAGVLSFLRASSPRGEPIMSHNLRRSLLIATMVVFVWATSSEACHRRGGYAGGSCGSGGYGYAGPAGYYDGGGGYYGGGYAGGMAGAPAYSGIAGAPTYPGYGGGYGGYGGY